MNEAHCPDCGRIVGWDSRKRRWVDEATGTTHWYVCPERERFISGINLDVHEPVTVQKPAVEPVRLTEMEYIPL